MRRHRKGALTRWLYVIYMVLADLLMLTAASSMQTAVIAVLNVNPPPKDLAEKIKPKKPVVLWGVMEWQRATPNDLDLWVECVTLADARKNTVIVSYRQRTDGWLDLSQDDQGAPSPENFEVVNSNSNIWAVPPRTVCTFNVHHYAAKGGPIPMHGVFKLWWKMNTPEEVLLANLNFSVQGAGEERTLLVVHWDERGQLDRDTTTSYPTAQTRFIATAKGNSSQDAR